MILDIAVFFGVLALLVLAHEFGHFISARRNGVGVEEFGFGFPPRLFGFKKGETLYSFNLLPLGGFVKITGENETASLDPKNFASKGLAQRAVILSAGVAFNLLLAFFIFSFAVFVGLPIDASSPLRTAGIRDPYVLAIEILPDSPAESAGIFEGDKILALETLSGTRIAPVSVSEVQEFTRSNYGEKMSVEVKRNNEFLVLSAVLSGDKEAPLGLSLAEIGIIDAPWYKAPFAGLELTIIALGQVIGGLYFLLKLVFSGVSVAGLVSGPVGIFAILSETLEFGFPILLSFVGILSVNLAVINLIPIPGLDGGRLFFLAIEAVRGKPVGQKISGLAHAAGFAILIMLMAAITYLDIRMKL